MQAVGGDVFLILLNAAQGKDNTEVMMNALAAPKIANYRYESTLSYFHTVLNTSFLHLAAASLSRFLRLCIVSGHLHT